MKHTVPQPVAAPTQSRYACAQCNHLHVLTNRDPIRCTKCGYRIMYKQRGEALIHCSAR